jgi:hypothetical protein
MADAVAKQDITVLARLARASLAQWLDALDGLPDNPVFRLVRATPHRRGAQAWAARAWDYLPPATSAVVFIYLGASHQLATLQARMDPLVLALLGAAILLFTTWLISGWYNVAYAALALISEPGTLGRGELQLDEGLLATGITERDLVLGMVFGVGGRALSRLLAAAAAVPVGLWVTATSITGQEHPTLLGAFAQVIGANTAFSTRVLVYAVMSTAFLALLSLPAGLALLLWLTALGRSIQQRWQLQLVACSISLAQVAWIPLALFQILCWQNIMPFESLADSESVAAVLAPLTVLILLVGGLVLSERYPGSRTAIAALAPWLFIATATAAVLARNAALTFSGVTGGSQMLYNLSWLASCLTLINPLAVPFREWLGISPECPLLLRAFDWYRLPGILLMQGALIVICAAAARQAVAAWRYRED